MTSTPESSSSGNLKESIVRLDVVESWATKAYAAQAMPGWHNWALRMAVMALCCDGKAIYVETRGLARNGWEGKFSELGAPTPPPKLFEHIQHMRMHRSPHQTSYVLNFGGKPRIVRFTGFVHKLGINKSVKTGAFVSSLLIPEAGHVIEGVESGLSKAKNTGARERAIEAADAWRSVLEGKVDPASLPRLYQS